MSVQLANRVTEFISKCPIVINTNQSILSFKTSTNVLVPQNVTSTFSSCNPTDNGLMYTIDGKVNSCCSSDLPMPTGYNSNNN